MNLDTTKEIIIPEGNVEKITNQDGNIIWQKSYMYALVSNGTQVIDTGVYCTNKMSCEIKMAYTAFPTSATYIGAIQYNNGTYYRCHFQVAYSGGDKVIGFWQDSPTVGNAISIPFDTNPHIFTYSAPKMTVGIDGVVSSHGNTPTPSNCTFYLFDRNVTGFTANAEPGKCIVYYAKFWEDGELIRHFVPRKNSNNKYGLFDLVNEKFYFDKNGNNFSAEIFG